MIRRIFFIAAILALLAITFISCKLLTFEETPAPTPTPFPTVGPPPTAIKATPTPAPTPIPLNYYSFGELATSSPWQITISQPQWATSYNAPGTQKPPPGGIFLLVPVAVWNVGSTSFQVSAQNFQLISAAGAIYGAKTPPLSINTQNPFPYNKYTVQPSGSVNGIIIYTPPTGATDLSIRILVNGQYLVWDLP